MSSWIARLCWATIAITAASPVAARDNAGSRFRALHGREWTWRQAQFAGEDNEDRSGEFADHPPRSDATIQAMRLR